MAEKMSKIYKILISCLMMFVFYGCSATTPNASRIITDLNSSDFIREDVLYIEKDSTIPVTSIDIYETIKNEDSCKINCNVIQSDDNYKKSSDMIISYVKFDGWSFSNYDIKGVVSVTPLGPVPEQIIRNAVQSDTRWNTEIKNISHNFDPQNITDTVTIECVKTSETYKKSLTITENYKFREWWYGGGEENITSSEWLVNQLEGSEWYVSPGVGVRSLRINKIDVSNQTIDIDYGLSELNHHEICRYKKEYNQYGSDETIIIPLSFDFYDIQILDTGIRFGELGMMKKISGNNNTEKNEDSKDDSEAHSNSDDENDIPSEYERVETDIDTARIILNYAREYKMRNYEITLKNILEKEGFEQAQTQAATGGYLGDVYSEVDISDKDNFKITLTTGEKAGEYSGTYIIAEKGSLPEPTKQ